MSRTYKQLFLFAGFSIVVYFIMLLFWGSVVPANMRKNLLYKLGGSGHFYSRLREADSTSNVDILFLGSSRAYRGYDPRVFKQYHYSSFNLGSSSQTPVQTALLFDKYSERLNPKLVVLDIFPLMLSNDGIESTLDMISNMEIDPSITAMALCTKNVKVYNTLLYAGASSIAGDIRQFNEPLKRREDTYIQGGYVESTRKFRSRDSKDSGDIKVSGTQLSALKKIIGKLQEHHTPYVLVYSPVVKEAYNKFSNTDSVDAIMSQLGRYYNFNKTLPLGEEYFFDEYHLNQKGVELFNTKLVEQLKKDNVLK